jgi:hypothetical protein
VDGTEAEGVIGGCRCGGRSVCSDAEVMTDPFSDAVEGRRTIFGRVDDGNEGVRECRISIRVAREMGWMSGTPLRNAKVLTCTDLSLLAPSVLANSWEGRRFTCRYSE